MNIRTRFAPSPTGKLHIGGIRTAIFNWLFARKNKGKFYLRIEDTDKERSKVEYVDSIKSGLQWLGLNWDDEIVFQSENKNKHIEIINHLLKQQKAYYCYATQEEIQNFKQNNPGKKFISKWRDKTSNRINNNLKPVVRLKTPLTGAIILNDKVLGKIEVNNCEIDDMVIMRSDNTPTYNISCVIDDHDMQISHVIRGNDHLTNTFRQIQILNALNWEKPIYAHIPLIHGSDGNKMSKRDGAIDVNEYNKLGYLPEATFNYLLKLGWSLGDEEIISIQKALENFDLNQINRSPARFDIDKLNFINQHYIKSLNDTVIYEELIKKIDPTLLNNNTLEKIKKSIPLIKSRGQTINNLVDLANIFISYSSPTDEQSQKILALKESKEILEKLLMIIEKIENWGSETLKNECQALAKILKIKSPIIMKTLRAGALGTFNSPPIYQTLEILSKEEVVNRMTKTINTLNHN